MTVEIDVLVAVHHPTRRRLLDLLTTDGPAQVGALARALGVQVGSVSHHLRVLERAGVVARAPELSTDGRTSWWRATGLRLTWSADDFADSPADRVRAEAAERLQVQRGYRALADWHRRRAAAPPEHRDAATSIDWTVRATPEQLRDLAERLGDVVSGWTTEIRSAPAPEGAIVSRGFVHVFPSEP